MNQIDVASIKETVDLRELAGRYTTLQNPESKRRTAPVRSVAARIASMHSASGGSAGVLSVRQWQTSRRDRVRAVGGKRGLPRGLQALGRQVFRPGKVGETGSQSIQAGLVDPDWQTKTKRELTEAQARLENREGERGRAYLAERRIEPDTWRAWVLIRHAMAPSLKQPRPAIVLPWQGKGTIKAVEVPVFS